MVDKHLVNIDDANKMIYIIYNYYICFIQNV